MHIEKTISAANLHPANESKRITMTNSISIQLKKLYTNEKGSVILFVGEEVVNFLLSSKDRVVQRAVMVDLTWQKGGRTVADKLP